MSSRNSPALEEGKFARHKKKARLSSMFSDEEITTFLKFINSINSFSKMDGQVQRNIDIYIMLAEKTSEQCPYSIKTGTENIINNKSIQLE